jgi:hypothetical protein
MSADVKREGVSMKKKLNLLVMLVCLLALSLIFIGCDNGTTGDGGNSYVEWPTSIVGTWVGDPSLVEAGKLLVFTNTGGKGELEVFGEHNYVLIESIPANNQYRIQNVNTQSKVWIGITPHTGFINIMLSPSSLFDGKFNAQ